MPSARVLTNPLVLSSAFSSLAGAGATVIAVWRLDIEAFAQFAAIALVLPFAQGIVRALVHEPTLVKARGRPRSDVRFALFLTASVAASVASFALLVAACRLRPTDALIIVSGLTLTWIADFVRYRLLLRGRRTRIAVGDGLRVVLTAILLIPAVAPDAILFGWLVGASAGALVVVGGVAALKDGNGRVHPPLRDQSIPQALDFVTLQASSSIPLLFVAGGGAALAVFAVVRLTQTLLGPLNFVFMAMNTTLMADGATTPTLGSDSALLSRGRVLARAVLVLATIAVVLVTTAMLLFGRHFIEVDNPTIILGTLLVGATFIGSGWSGIQIVILRLLGKAKQILIARVALVVVVLSAYAIGLVTGGAALSVGFGLAASALAYPLLFGVTARRVLRIEGWYQR